MHNIQTIEAKLNAKHFKFALVAARFNDFIVKNLIGGAVDYLIRHNVKEENLTLIRTPGCGELPLAVKVAAQSKKYHGIICLGAIIKGETHHFDLLAHETSKSLSQLMLEYNLPIGFGIVATYNLEQAIERAGNKVGNQGAAAAAACLDMANLLSELAA
jgi:6,7-dimethyl-8-ribityllumazine synthase